MQVARGAELGRPLTEAEVVERFIGRSSVPIREQVTERLGPGTAALWWYLFEERHRKAVDRGLSPAERLEGPGTVVFDDMRDLPGLLTDH